MIQNVFKGACSGNIALIQQATEETSFLVAYHSLECTLNNCYKVTWSVLLERDFVLASTNDSICSLLDF